MIEKMGQDYSLPGDLVTHFTMDEIKRLGKRFRKLDTDGSGTLSIEEFMHLPELQQNPLVQRVIEIFDTDGNKEIDFKEFIEGISQFSVKGDKNSKLKFAFQVLISCYMNVWILILGIYEGRMRKKLIDGKPEGWKRRLVENDKFSIFHRVYNINQDGLILNGEFFTGLK